MRGRWGRSSSSSNIVVVVVEDIVIVRFDAQYQYLRCYSSNSDIWLDTWYRYVGCLRHPQCTDRNITPFCLLGKWGVKLPTLLKIEGFQK